jgi:PAS domain S-box-containing protein
MTASRSSSTRRRYRGSLARRLVFAIWGLSLIPVLFLGVTTFYRSRTLLRDQTTTQLRTIVQSEANEMNRAVENHRAFLKGIGEDKTFSSNLDEVLRGSTDLARYHTLASSKVLADYKELAKTQTEDLSNDFLVIDINGNIISSTNSDWSDINFRQDELLSNLVDTDKTILTYNNPRFGDGEFVLLNSKVYLASDSSSPHATLVNIAVTHLPQSILETATSFYPSAQAYFYTPSDSILKIDPLTNNLLAFKPKVEQSNALSSLLTLGERAGETEYISNGDTPVLTYGQYIPVTDISLVIEIPQEVVYAPFNESIPSIIGLMLFAMLVIGGLIWLGTSSIVRSIMELATSTQHFADGNWQSRSRVKRNDEIGLLADSFNHMADDLSAAYYTVKSESEERTRQLRAAAEVAQLATSAQTADELFERTVSLLIERFGYYHAAILIPDMSGKNLVVKEAAGEAALALKEQGYQIALNSQSIVSWVANNRKSRTVSSVTEDQLFLPNSLLPETQSEVGVPILHGDELQGVLDVQSANPQAFNDESVVVLQTLANQTASALKNMKLAETTEVNLAENLTLYDTSRLIVASENETEIFQRLTSVLNRSGLISALLIFDGDRFKVASMHDPEDRSKVKFPEWVSIPLIGIEGNLPTDHPTYYADINQAPSGLSGLLSIPRRFNCNSVALFPVTSSGKFSGILLLASRSSEGIHPASLQPYGNLANIAGATIERIRLLDAAERSNAEYRILTDISRVISIETDLDQLYPSLYREIQKTTGQIDFLVALYDSRQDRLDIPYCMERNEFLPVTSIPLGEGLISTVIKNRKPLMLVKDTLQQARAMGAKIIGKPAKSWLGVPLMVGGNLIGAMVIQDLDHEGRFAEKDLHLMTALASQIAVTIRNVQLLTEMSHTLSDFEQEKSLLDALLENTPDAIFFKNREGQYTRASKSMTRMVNIKDAADIAGKSDFDFMEPEEASRIYKEEQEIMTSGIPQMGIMERHTIPGQGDIWTMTSRLPLKNSQSEIAGLLGISSDITELKTAQELSQLRAQQVRTAAEIARDTSSTLELSDLLYRAVNLARDRFGFYHVSVFLLDPLGQYAVVRESTGEAGMQMKNTGHKLAVGSQSLVGQATSKGEPIVINDVYKEITHFRNPLLPDTQAEAAVPLKIGDRIIGALDVQSTHTNAFSPEDISILQVLADQLAIAVTNSNLFSEAQDNLAQHRLLHHITTAAASSDSVSEALKSSVDGLRIAMGGDRVSIFLLKSNQNLLEVGAFAGYLSDKIQQLQIPLGKGITGQAAAERQIIRIQNVQEDPRYISVDTLVRSEMAVPLVFREELLGVLNFESDQPGAYSESDQEMMGTLGSSLAAIIANARLLERIRAQVDRDEQLYEITSKIRRSVDIQSILEISATEIGRYLNSRRTQIDIDPQLISEDTAGSSQSTPSNGNGSHPEVE